MNAPSIRLDGTEPRCQTLAFRLTSSERESIDALARAGRMSASEFARQAVFAALRDISSALDAAAQQGRDEIRPQVTKLQDELTEMREVALDSQRSAALLESRLVGAPDELLAAVRHLLAGGPGAKEQVARCWSLLGYSTRSEFIPTVAAALGDEVDQSLARFHMNEAGVNAAVELVDRLKWLKAALTTESGRRLYSPARDELSRTPEPVEAVYLQALQRVSHRVEWLSEYEAKRSTPTAVTTSESAEPP